MKCPNCYSVISANSATCPRCDWQLAPKPRTDSELAASNASVASNSWKNDQPAGTLWNQSYAEDGVQWKNDQPAGAAWDQAFADQQHYLSPSQNGETASAAPAGFDWHMQHSVVGAPQTGAIHKVALNGAQKNELAGTLLLSLFAAGIAVVMLFFIWSQFAFLKGLELFVFVAVAGFIVWNALRQAMHAYADLQAGVAFQQHDYLTDKQRVRGKNSTRYYGHFKTSGKLQLKRAMYRTVQTDQFYRVTYAPHSKVVWQLEAEHPLMGQQSTISTL